MMKKTLFVLVSVLLVMLVSCNLNLYTSAFSDQTINTAISEDSSFDGSAPVVLTATKAGYTDKIVLSWSSVAGADYYQISRAVEGSSEFTVLPVSVKETTYEDVRTNSNPLSSGVRYQYKINARSNTVTLSETTNYSPVAAGSLLCAPSELSAGKGASETGIVITWSTMPDVRKYAVYKSDSPSFDKADNFIASVPALQNVGSQSYKYMVSDTEEGKELYFKVASVSANGTVSDLSIFCMGYSQVVGAPTAPTNVTASQGVGIQAKTTPFVISWDKGSGSYEYIVYRSAPGSSETKVYPQGSVTLADDGSRYALTDKYDLKAITTGTVYTYTVVPTTVIGGETVKGLTSTATAYLLSAPNEVTLGLTNSSYELSFPQVLGLATTEERTNHSSWSYIVTRKTVNGASEEVTLRPSDFSDLVTYSSPYDSNGVPDDQFTIFNVKVYNGDAGLTTAPTDDQTITAPTAPAGFAVTADVYIKSMAANGNGVYPVHVSWDLNKNIDHYLLQVFKSGSTSALTTVTIKGSATSYDVSIAEAVVGEKYDFCMKGVDVLGRESGYTVLTTGYGAITAEKWVNIWLTYAFKPWEYYTALPTSMSNEFFTAVNLQSYWKDGAINGYISKAGTGSLGSATQTCHYAHGTHTGALNSGNTTDFGSVAYSAEVEGIGGAVYFKYYDFGEVPYFSSTGNYEMHVNASGTGSVKTTTTNGFTILGMYPGYLGLGSVSVSNKAFSGSYTVKLLDGQGTVSVPCR